MTLTLHSYVRTEVTAVDALAALGEQAKIPFVPVIVSTPRRCQFLRWHEGHAQDEFGQQFQGWNEVWEVRAFTPSWELRWRRESDGTTHAVIVGEAQANHLQEWSHLERKVLESNDLQYILWGTKLERGPTLETGWTRLWEHQIGPLLAPVHATEVPKQGRVVIRAREYFAEVDEDGNTACIEERLYGLSTDKGNK